eukprot:5174036-Pleurochrysis_carterae.AAC.1
MPAGFLFGCLADCYVNNWEVYRIFDVPPVLSDLGDPGSAARYAPPCHPVKLIAGGDCVELDGGAHFVPAVTGSVAAAGKLSKELPRRVWVCDFLLGGVWKHTKERMEKRRWALLLLFKDTEPEVTELHLAGFFFYRVSGREREVAHQFGVRKRSQSGINSVYAAIARVCGMTDADESGVTSTDAGVDASHSDTSLRIAMDLNGTASTLDVKCTYLAHGFSLYDSDNPDAMKLMVKRLCKTPYCSRR